MNELLKEAFQLFLLYEEKFIEVKKTIEVDIVRSELYKGPYYEISPYSYQRSGFKKGKPIKNHSLIKDYSDVYCYSFDQNNRLIMIKEGTSFSDLFHYTFIMYRNGYKISLQYDYDEELSNSRIYLYDENGKINSMYSKGHSGAKNENYIYHDGILKLIEINQFDKDGEKKNTIIQEFIYIGEGELHSIIKYPEDKNYSEIIFHS